MSANLKRRLAPLLIMLLLLTVLCLLIQVTWGNTVLSTFVAILSLMVTVAGLFLSEKVLFPKLPETGMKLDQSGEDDLIQGGVIDGHEEVF